MKKIKVAINGFGRIGRAFFKLAREREEIEVVAFNDLGDLEMMAYLLRYDSVYGKSNFDIKVEAGAEPGILVDGKKVLALSEEDPTRLPWKELGIDLVVESTGFFTSYEKAKVHLDAGAKRVVITAPLKEQPQTDADLPAKNFAGQNLGGQAQTYAEGITILMGLNEDKLKLCKISSNASCTTNAGSPIIAILDEAVGIERAVLNTVHGYTATQSLIDGPSKKDLREGRAAAENIVPSSTGAAVATTKAFTKLSGKFDGISIRVPVVCGSIVDITFVAKRPTSALEINAALRAAATAARWKGIFTVTDEPLVSRDILGNPHASIADLAMTRVVDGTLIKVLAWYDNETGYTNTLVAHVIKAGEQLK